MLVDVQLQTHHPKELSFFKMDIPSNNHSEPFQPNDNQLHFEDKESAFMTMDDELHFHDPADDICVYFYIFEIDSKNVASTINNVDY